MCFLFLSTPNPLKTSDCGSLDAFFSYPSQLYNFIEFSTTKATEIPVQLELYVMELFTCFWSHIRRKKTRKYYRNGSWFYSLALPRQFALSHIFIDEQSKVNERQNMKNDIYSAAFFLPHIPHHHRGMLMHTDLKLYFLPVNMENIPRFNKSEWLFKSSDVYSSFILAASFTSSTKKCSEKGNVRMETNVRSFLCCKIKVVNFPKTFVVIFVRCHFSLNLQLIAWIFFLR